MSDIVERLRDHKGFWLNGAVWIMGTEPDVDCAEGADEIERLRSLLKAEKTTLELRWQDVERLEADNERLRAALLEIRQQCAVGESHIWIDRVARRTLEQEN